MCLLPNSSSLSHTKSPFHQHQLQNFASLLQHSPVSNSLLNSSSTLSVHPSSNHHKNPFKANHNNYGLIRPLIANDQLTMISSSSPLFTSSSPSLTSSSNNSSFNSAVQHYQVKDGVLMFGATETSCSSSDGSSNNVHHHHHQQQQQAKEFDYDNEHHDQQLFKMGDNINQQGTSTNFTDYITGFCNQNGSWSNASFCNQVNNPLEDYGLEEIKQLVTTSSWNKNSLLLFDQESRREERVMFY
ncbi:hypothetical protein LINPERHAP2_LOCUS21037 [Linum perenne]